MKKLEIKKMENLIGGKLCAGDKTQTTIGAACAAAVIILFTPFAPLSGSLAITCAVGFTCN